MKPIKRRITLGRKEKQTMLALFFCMFYLSTQVFSQGLLTCPSDWLYRDGSCYRAYTTQKSWNEALQICQGNQGYLVSLNSAAEQQFVYNNMAVNKTFWIGLVKNRSLGIFRWSNGQRLSYQNWIVMPNISEPEDCGEMTDYSVFRGMWNDQSCSAMLPFICEKGALLSGRYFKRIPGKQLTNHVVSHVTASSDLECLLWCQQLKNCQSVNYIPLDVRSKGICELNDASGEGFPRDLVDNNKYDYHESL